MVGKNMVGKNMVGKNMVGKNMVGQSQTYYSNLGQLKANRCHAIPD
ncbi:hypothetical protein N483_18405 [Pseudoalteromonas luteoviolacea NCIMB 1944]|uniref:Uncharacterized protein n=1 Tax=Pseudoalteromonas luteoviolacea (strain 2ta16) TaxID=1353533 RepID=V4J8E6_PSEL2|nr:hypothetical protein PL2TA16_00311 [Pseudoalteromonas luteoviolacea 2ta16]KZN40162.1 hypothetical protein N483_18405 [Pseudoalteromonas luteoviolacea NCIMB 1944]